MKIDRQGGSRTASKGQFPDSLRRRIHEVDTLGGEVRCQKRGEPLPVGRHHGGMAGYGHCQGGAIHKTEVVDGMGTGSARFKKGNPDVPTPGIAHNCHEASLGILDAKNRSGSGSTANAPYGSPNWQGEAGEDGDSRADSRKRPGTDADGKPVDRCQVNACFFKQGSDEAEGIALSTMVILNRTHQGSVG